MHSCTGMTSCLADSFLQRVMTRTLGAGDVVVYGLGNLSLWTRIPQDAQLWD